jgi:pimeloyl-ACP methyl ester carboxylesterase
VYRNEVDARELGSKYGGMARLVLLDSTIARSVCAISCRHRGAAGWMMAAMAPRWPLAVSRRSVLHTWQAYRQSLNDLILTTDWKNLLNVTVPLTVIRGTKDNVGDRRYLDSLLAPAAIVTVPDGDHHVALTHPHLLFELLEDDEVNAS